MPSQWLLLVLVIVAAFAAYEYIISFDTVWRSEKRLNDRIDEINRKHFS